MRWRSKKMWVIECLDDRLLYSDLQHLLRSTLEQLRQSVFCNCLSTFELNNVILHHGGVSLWLSWGCGNYKVTRYAAFFNPAQTPDLAIPRMLHMMFKLGQCAQKRWHRLRGFDHLPNVIRGVQFSDGIEVKTANQDAA